MIDANLIWVLTGCALIGAGASVVGVFAYLRKQSLVGDAVAHSVLPGIVLAFIIFESRSPWALFPGAIAAGWLSVLSIDAITKYSKIKADAAIAIVLSLYFAVGIVLLTYVQTSGYDNHSGLDAFLFGQAASMLPGDIILFIAVDLALILCVLVFYPYFKIVVFDRDYAKAIGLPVRFISVLLSTLTILAIATGIQAVGVVLMAALIITPAAAGRFFANRLGRMLVFATITGMVSALAGVAISFSAPAMPTGPWIVVALSLVAISAFFLAPGRGLLHRVRRRIRHQYKISDENVLKLLYQRNEAGQGNEASLNDIVAARRFDTHQLSRSLKRLSKQGYIRQLSGGISLTEKGFTEAMRIVRLHRLWELYLNTRLNIAEDHVHHAAEAIEHIITPEIEAALLRELDYPELDPHQSVIPGVKKKR